VSVWALPETKGVRLTSQPLAAPTINPLPMPLGASSRVDVKQ
jgi:hypothetical protein